MPADRRSEISFVVHSFLNSPRKEGPHFTNNVAAGWHGKRAGVTPSSQYSCFLFTGVRAGEDAATD